MNKNIKVKIVCNLGSQEGFYCQKVVYALEQRVGKDPGDGVKRDFFD